MILMKTQYLVTTINSLIGTISREVDGDNAPIIHRLAAVLKAHPEVDQVQYTYKAPGFPVTQVIVSKKDVQ
jgi:hypothetical protein